MSCFIINNKTASSIVTALIEMNRIHDVEAQGFLDIIMELNYKAYDSRYEDENSQLRYIFIRQHTDFSTEKDKNMYVMQMIKNIDCYFYQVSGIDDYEDLFMDS